MQNPNITQVGGDHYRQAAYQHWDFVAAFGLNYFLGNATKYISRHDKKNGKQDLQKAIHYVQKIEHLIRSGVVLDQFISRSQERTFQVEHRRFCEANSLGYHEAMIIYDLCVLTNGCSEIPRLVQRLEQLIDQCYPDGSEPGTGYVNQDR